MAKVTSWGMYPIIEGELKSPSSLQELKEAIKNSSDFIPRGNGRSYGDSSLSRQMISGLALNKVLHLDEQSGVINCEAGVLLSDLLTEIVPKGFFLPVTPGTKFITIGGALASDIHGKNHHVDGVFSDHVLSFELIDEKGEQKTVKPGEDLFYQTAGGMGLTGFIYSVTFKLKKIESAYIRQRSIRAKNLAEVFDLFEKNQDATYSVAWIDCLQKGENLGRSILMLGEHATKEEIKKDKPLLPHKDPFLNVPFKLPSFVLNKLSVKAFNFAYYHNPLIKKGIFYSHYEPFFYPLDKINNWNRIYGNNGFTQYQFVLPKEKSQYGISKILKIMAEKGEGSFLAVLKLFGKSHDNRYLHFPIEGYTLAIDFKLSEGVFKMLDQLDEIVNECGGKIYLTKDSRMSSNTFKKQYSNQIKKENHINSVQSNRLNNSMNTLLVLGANSDMAKAYTKLWLSKNPNGKAILASRNTADLNTFISSNQLINCTSVAFDASNFESHYSFYNSLANKPSEVLYAAGVMFDNDSAIKNWKESSAMIDVNYKGAVSIINIILADTSNTSLKRIVGISSLAGIRARKSNFMYGMTKGAFTQYLQGLNQEYSDKGILVQSINPGFVKTKMTAHLQLNEGLAQTPEQIADVMYKNQKSIVVFTSLKWKLIALIIKFLPTFIIKKMK